MLKINQLC